jgi:hypothetical protein
MVSIAMVEFLFHPVSILDPHAPPQAASPNADPADPIADNLDDEHPELFQ